MAKIPLRAYNNEIDQLVENGQIAEAIAHCKYILKAFPKHIDSYRLLGQAYLTNQRYTEAADILQRVLSVIPDDFISQIGMSIIREDEGNLDAAIYHMEKAFEVQPAKAAIQSELRRLYGRRDGMEPPKIRLTRGALVRMYMRGELYPQAIAEVRAALADDPNQLDLQVILAKLYDLAGQKVQAVEICSRLVAKLPYCLEANRILAEVLPGTSRADDAKVFKDRVVAIDPYAAYVQEGQNDSAGVPDAAVQIERLEYNAAADVSEQPEWTQTVGVAWDDKETSDAAAWMEDTQVSADQAPAEPLAAADEEVTAAPAEIPEWMAAAGWSPSAGEAVETPVEFSEEEEPTAGEGLVSPGEIPDWLQNLAPATPTAEEPAAETSEEDEAWLQKMMGSEVPTAAGEVETLPEETAPQVEAPEWMWEEKSAETGAAVQPEAQETELPDWLKNLSAEEKAPEATAEISAVAPAEQEETLPDWLQSLGGESETAEEPAAAVAEAPAEEEGLPDWLQGLGEEAAGSVDMPQEPAVSELPAQPSEELPDWLQGLGEEAAGEVETVQEQPVSEIPAQPGEDLPDWLQAQAAGQPVEELPAWLQQAQAEETEAALPELETGAEIEVVGAEVEAIAPEAVAAEEVEQVVAEISPAEPAAEQVTTELNPEEDLDSALAWLESLAAKQGADEAELLTQPGQRNVELPAWMKEEAQQAEGMAAEVPAEETVSEISEASTEAELGEPAGALVFETFEERNEIIEAVAEAPEEQAVKPVEIEEMPAQEDIQAQVEVPEVEEAAPVMVEEIPAELPSAVEATSPASMEEQPAVEMEQPAPLSTEEPAAVDSASIEETKPVRIAPPAVAEEALPETAEAGLIEIAAGEEIPLEVGETVAELPETEEAGVQAPVEEKGEPVVIEEVPPVEAAEAVATPFEADMPEDLDSALAWLESLAAKQGAEEATLLTSPESRLETPPEWVTTEAAQAGEPAEPAAEMEEAGAAAEMPEALEAIDTPPVEETFPVSESLLGEAEDETAKMPAPPVMEGWTPEIEILETDAGSEEALPDWLQSLTEEEETLPGPEEGALPEWLQEMDTGEEALTPAVSAGEWTPESAAEEAPVAAVEEIREEVTPVEEVESTAAVAREETQPVPVAAAQPSEPVEEPPTPAVERGDLEQARKALEKGEVESALECYAALTQSGAQLEEVIHDLRDATYRFPVNSDIWQALGDAYRQGNHVQDALDAYTKAIELLR